MNGTGLLLLSNSSTNYTGNTTVSSGTLETFNARNFSWGPTSPANTISVASGAMLMMYSDTSSGNAGDGEDQGIGPNTGTGTTITARDISEAGKWHPRLGVEQQWQTGNVDDRWRFNRYRKRHV